MMNKSCSTCDKKNKNECTCPCDLLSECTGVKKCNTEECSGYCVDLPHGIQEKEINIKEKEGCIEISYAKEVKDKNSSSKRTGFYSFSLPEGTSLGKTEVKGSKLFITTKGKNEVK